MTQTDGLVLSATSLWSKWGFNDGDPPEELFGTFDDEIYEQMSARWDDVLEFLIRKHLLPLLEGVEIKVWGTIHNPFRAVDYPNAAPARFEGISVTVPWSVVKECLLYGEPQ